MVATQDPAAAHRGPPAVRGRYPEPPCQPDDADDPVSDSGNEGSPLALPSLGRPAAHRESPADKHRTVPTGASQSHVVPETASLSGSVRNAPSLSSSAIGRHNTSTRCVMLDPPVPRFSVLDAAALTACGAVLCPRASLEGWFAGVCEGALAVIPNQDGGRGYFDNSGFCRSSSGDLNWSRFPDGDTVDLSARDEYGVIVDVDEEEDAHRPPTPIKNAGGQPRSAPLLVMSADGLGSGA
jgi:hypothetical protein